MIEKITYAKLSKYFNGIETFNFYLKKLKFLRCYVICKYLVKYCDLANKKFIKNIKVLIKTSKTIKNLLFVLII